MTQLNDSTGLHSALSEIVSLVDGDYSDQVDGVAMWSPLGPVLANIFMCNFEEKWVANVDSRPSI